MRHHHPRRLVALAAAGVVGILLAGALPAAAVGGPSAVGTGDVFLEEFDDFDAWTALTATVGEWTTADGTVSIDAQNQSSGRYLRLCRIIPKELA